MNCEALTQLSVTLYLLRKQRKATAIAQRKRLLFRLGYYCHVTELMKRETLIDAGVVNKNIKIFCSALLTVIVIVFIFSCCFVAADDAAAVVVLILLCYLR